jgi:hypothetical protein
MKPLPLSLTKKMFIVASRHYTNKEEYELSLVSYNPQDGTNSMGYILIGETEVTVDVPQINVINAEIEAIKKARDELLAEAQLKANNLNHRIEQLLAIEYKPEEV